jgi:hypothetical protein
VPVFLVPLGSQLLHPEKEKKYFYRWIYTLAARIYGRVFDLPQRPNTSSRPRPIFRWSYLIQEILSSLVLRELGRG